MKITFLGAAEEVTGSMHLLEVDSGSILIDCGFVQGRREASRVRNEHLPPEASWADAVILTHAHIDHSGSLPTLAKTGFRGPIYATSATVDLCGYMLGDSAHIQKNDAEYLNKKYEDDPGFVPIEPIYEQRDVEQVLSQFVATEYHEVFHPLPGVTAHFLNAGHILGSAQVVLDVETNGQTRRILFSGDLGRSGLPILRDPELPPTPLDYVVMESTYGDRAHAPVASMHDDLARVINDTCARGGKVIVPAFAVGRTQELIYALNALRRSGKIPPIPLVIDSPLAVQVTEVFKRHPECFDGETREFLDTHGEVFGFGGIQFSSTREQSISINRIEGSAIIISAAGMAEAGRILHHLRNNIEDPRNTILIVGFMAQHTLGRRLVERRPWVKIWGVERELRAQVEVLSAFSAHADCNDLLAYAKACGATTRQFFLVHGESDAQTALAQAMQGERLRVEIPSRGRTVELV